MFTKNWYKALSAILGYDNSSITAANMSGESTVVTVYNTNNLLYGYESSNTFITSMYFLRDTLTTNACGVILGTGTTSPTVDDVCLSGELVTGYTYTTVLTKEAADDGYTITALYTITNANTEDITIGEIGLMGSAAQNASVKYKLLLERTVLDSPVTIPAGGVGQVTYTIRMNYPTA